MMVDKSKRIKSTKVKAHKVKSKIKSKIPEVKVVDEGIGFVSPRLIRGKRGVVGVPAAETQMKIQLCNKIIWTGFLIGYVF